MAKVVLFEVVLCIFILLGTFCHLADGQCSNLGSHGSTSTYDVTDGTGVGDDGFLVSDSNVGKSTCCGTLTDYELTSGSITGQTVYLQVWRPNTGACADCYDLVQEDNFLINDPNTDYTVNVNIPVEADDVIGWRSDIIPYDLTGPWNGVKNLTHSPVPVEGVDTVDWNPATIQSGRTYAFGAIVSANNDPTMSPASPTASIGTDWPIATPVYTVTGADADPGEDETTLTYAMTTTSSLFEFDSDPSSGTFREVSVQATATLIPGTYPLDFTITDRCGGTATGTLTITVTNQPPVFGANSVGPYTIGEGQTTAMCFTTVQVSDPESDTVTCTASVPGGNQPFEIDGSNQLCSKASPTLTPPSYTVTVSCSDPYNTAITLDFTVNVNEAPTYTAQTLTHTVAEDQLTAALIHTITLSDPEGDTPLTCTVDTSTTYFEINNDVEIWLKVHAGFGATSYTVDTSCTDTANAETPVTETFTVDINQEPDFNAQADFSVAATQLTALNLGTIDVTDAEGDTITCTEGAGSDPFEIQNDDEFWLKAHAGFASTTYSITVDCSDGQGNTNTKVFTVNVNQAPVFPAQTTSYTVGETQTAAQVLGTVSVTDADAGDTITCALVDPSLPFEITQTSATEYDFGSPANPGYSVSDSPYTVEIDCDDGVNSPATRLTITVTVNEPPTYDAQTLVHTVAEDQLTATLIHTIALTDPETDTPLTCTVDTFTSFFEIQNDVEIWLKAHAGFGATTYAVDTSCSDPINSANPVSQTFTISINQEPDFNTQADFTVAATQLTALNLGTIDVTDAEGDTITCTEGAGSDPFEIQNDVEFWLKAHAGFASTTYSITVDCSDGQGNTNTKVFTVNVNQAPVFPAQTTAYTVGETQTAALVLGTVSVTDADAGDTITCVLVDPSLPFDITQTSATEWDFSSTASPGFSASDPPYTVEINCDDGVNSPTRHTKTVTINAAPVLNPNPGTFTVGEDAAAVTTAGTVTLTDAEAETVACTLVDASGKFQRTQGAGTVDIETVATPAFDAAVTDQYIVTLECSEDPENYNTATGTYTIDINHMPDINPTQADVFGVAEGDQGGVVLHTVDVTDNEGDTITCSVVDTSLPFELTGVPALDLTVKAGTNFVKATTATYSVDVQCVDALNPTGQTKTFTVDVNAAPTFDNLPGTGEVQDDETTQRCLETLAITDDEGDTITCTMTNQADIPFELIPNGATYDICLSDNPQLDWDSIQEYTAIIECADLYSTISDNYTITVINTPPVFDNPGGSADYAEGSITGLTLVKTILVTDTNDTITCVLADNPVGPFKVQKIVPPGDNYGLYVLPGINYEDATSYTVPYRCNDASTVISDTFTFNVINQTPTYNTLCGTITLDEDHSGETVIHTVNMTEVPTCTLTGDPNFSLDTGVNQILVTSSASFDFETTPQYTLTLDCNDGTTPTVDVTDTCTIDIINKGPKFTNIPFGVSVSEDELGESSLHDLTFDEPNSQIDNCQLTSAVPPFLMRRRADNNAYTIVKTAGLNLNFDTQKTYVLPITCTDTGGGSTTETATVTVTPNPPPVFTNVPGTVQASTLTVMDTDIITTITATDADPLTFASDGCFSETGNPCPFTLLPNGDVQATKDLALVKTKFWYMSVNVSDDWNNVGPETLVIELTDINTAPVITNANFTDSFPVEENTALGTAILDLEHYDPDTGETYTYDITYDTPGGDAFFALDPATGEITLISDVDYETQFYAGETKFDVTVMVDDGRENTTKSFSLEFANVNEEPVFENGPYTMTLGAAEECQNGQEFPDIDLPGQVNDPDLPFGDSITFKNLDCGGEEASFVMDPITGVVTCSEEFDMDAADRRLEDITLTCTVTVEDEKGLFDTETLFLVLNEENDNKPLLDKRKYSYAIACGSGSGVTVFDADHTDNDVKPEHKDITYSVSGSSFGVTAAGEVYNTISIPDCNEGDPSTKYQFQITADDGVHTDTVDVEVIAIPPTPVVVVTTTATAAVQDNQDELLGWLIPLAILGALLLGLSAFMIYRAGCCGLGSGSCRCLGSGPKPVKPDPVIRQVTPVRRVETPPKPPTPMKNIEPRQEFPTVNFWHHDRVGYM